MGVDYIPDRDNDFDQWEKNAVSYANSNMAALGLTMADLTAVQNEAEK